MKNLCFLNHSISAPFIRSIPVVVILPQRGGEFLFFRIPAHSLVGLQAPWHPPPCLHFVLLPRSRALKWFISCNFLTHAFFMQMIRSCFQGSVLLTGQAGTSLQVSQLTARRALISSDFDVCWARWAGVPTVLKRSESTLHSSAASPHLLWAGKGPSTAVLGSH